MLRCLLCAVTIVEVKMSFVFFFLVVEEGRRKKKTKSLSFLKVVLLVYFG